MANTDMAEVKYKKVLKEIFFHYNKSRSSNPAECFDMYQIYEYFSNTDETVNIKPTCSTDCTDENRLIDVLLHILRAKSGEMQHLIRSFFNKSKFDFCSLFLMENHNWMQFFYSFNIKQI